MMKGILVAMALTAMPVCANAQGLVGDVVGGALGTADTAVHDVLGGPRPGYYHRYHHHRCIYRHGHRYCRW